MNNQLSLKKSDLEKGEKSEIFEKVVDDIYNREINNENILKFEKPIRNLILIFNMHFEIMNGGLLQFVDNSTGDYFEETLNALQNIKAIEFVEILNKIKIKIFSSNVIPKNTDDRRDLIDTINENLTEKEEEEFEDFYEKIDDKYYDNEELLYKYVIEFTKQLVV